MQLQKQKREASEVPKLKQELEDLRTELEAVEAKLMKVRQHEDELERELKKERREKDQQVKLATAELRQLVPRGQATYAQPPATRSPFERARDATCNVGEKRHALHPNHFRASTRGS